MPIITLTSDYGPERFYAGILRGALAALSPDATVVDLSHDVRKFSSVDAALHALDLYEDAHGLVDGVLLLQPTSPFRTQQTIKKGITLFLGSNLSAVIGVSPTHSHPKWTFRIKDGALSPFLKELHIGS